MRSSSHVPYDAAPMFAPRTRGLRPGRTRPRSGLGRPAVPGGPRGGADGSRRTSDRIFEVFVVLCFLFLGASLQAGCGANHVGDAIGIDPVPSVGIGVGGTGGTTGTVAGS